MTCLSDPLSKYKYNINEFIPLTREEFLMNWPTYLKNIFKSRSNLVTKNIQLSEYIADMHVEHAVAMITQRSQTETALTKEIEALNKRIADLEKLNKDCIENMLIHANEKRSLINLLNKMQKERNKNVF